MYFMVVVGLFAAAICALFWWLILAVTIFIEAGDCRLRKSIGWAHNLEPGENEAEARRE